MKSKGMGYRYTFNLARHHQLPGEHLPFESISIPSCCKLLVSWFVLADHQEEDEASPCRSSTALSLRTRSSISPFRRSGIHPRSTCPSWKVREMRPGHPSAHEPEGHPRHQWRQRRAGAHPETTDSHHRCQRPCGAWAIRYLDAGDRGSVPFARLGAWLYRSIGSLGREVESRIRDAAQDRAMSRLPPHPPTHGERGPPLPLFPACWQEHRAGFIGIPDAPGESSGTRSARTGP